MRRKDFLLDSVFPFPPPSRLHTNRYAVPTSGRYYGFLPLAALFPCFTFCHPWLEQILNSPSSPTPSLLPPAAADRFSPASFCSTVSLTALLFLGFFRESASPPLLCRSFQPFSLACDERNLFSLFLSCSINPFWKLCFSHVFFFSAVQVLIYAVSVSAAPHDLNIPELAPPTFFFPPLTFLCSLRVVTSAFFYLLVSTPNCWFFS